MHLHTLVALTLVSFLQLSAPQNVDPSTIDDATKEKWCTDQTSACPLICLQLPGASGKPEQNNCTASSLTYTCVCSNGQQPNSSQYSQTIPYYECTQAATTCVNNCAQGDSTCQSACRNDHPCGAQSPTLVNTSTMTTMTSTSSGSTSTGSSGSTPSNTFAGLSGGSTGTSDASQKVQSFTLGFGRICGLASVLGGLSTGFIVLL